MQSQHPSRNLPCGKPNLAEGGPNLLLVDSVVHGISTETARSASIDANAVVGWDTEIVIAALR